MDAEHRHELKTNELADWLGHLPQFLHDNVRTIIGVVLIIAAVIVFLYSRRSSAQAAINEQAVATAQVEGLEMSKMQSLGQNPEAIDAITISANKLEEAAEEADNPNVAALLLIKHGEALRSDLHYKNEQVTADTIKKNIDKARVSYQKALETVEDNNTLTAMAEFGLALCDEEIGDYAKAEEAYKAIIANEAYAGMVFGAQAQQRLDNMADNKMQFVFVKAPPPVTPPEVKLPEMFTPGLTTPPTGGEDVKEITVTPNTETTDDTPDSPGVTEDAPKTDKPAEGPETN